MLFSGLSREVILKVVDKEVGLLAQDARRQEGHASSSRQAAREWLADNGYEPEFGARPMARLVESAIKRPLAEALLFGDLDREWRRVTRRRVAAKGSS